MSLLLLFGGSTAGSLSGPVADIAIGAPAGALFANPAGPVSNIAIGAPAGSLVLVLAGPVADIAIGAPAGFITVAQASLRGPLGVVLAGSANRVFLTPQFASNGVTLIPSPRGSR